MTLTVQKTKPGAGASPVDELSPQNPYPGPRSFDEGDRNFFCGRELQIREIFDRVRLHTLTVLHGKSGLGKTSLLQAGLFPRLRAEGYFPLRILFDFDALKEGETLADQLRERLRKAIADETLDAEPPAIGETLWHYFHFTAFWDTSGQAVIPVLVLDQFEEALLPRRKRAVSGLVRELADLVEGWVPGELAESVRTGETQQPEGPPRVKIVLSLREDALADLDDHRTSLPSLGAPRMRLLPLRGALAVEAVLKPAAKGRFIDEATAWKIVKNVAGEGAEGKEPEEWEVESSLLALYCFELNNDRLDKKQESILEGDITPQSRDEKFGAFYLRCIENAKVSSATRELIEDTLITGHRRNMILEETLTSETRGDMEKLVDAHLLRKEVRIGRAYLEIVHDVLVAPIEECAKSSRARRDRDRILRKWSRMGLAVAAAVGVVLVWRAWLAQEQAAKDLARLQNDLARLQNEVDRHGAETAESWARGRRKDAVRTALLGFASLREAHRIEHEVSAARAASRGVLSLPQGLITEPGPARATSPLLGLMAHRMLGSAGQTWRLLGDERNLRGLASSRSGRWGAVALGDGRSLRLFDAKRAFAWSATSISSEQRLRQEETVGAGKAEVIDWFEGDIQGLALSGDAGLVFAAGRKGQVAVFRFLDGERLFGFRTSVAEPTVLSDDSGGLVVLRGGSPSRVAIALRIDPLKKKIDAVIPLEPPARAVPPGKTVGATVLAPEDTVTGRWLSLVPSPEGEEVIGLWRDADRCQWRVWPIANEPGKNTPRDFPIPEPCGDLVTVSAGGTRYAMLLEGERVQIWERAGTTLRPEATFEVENKPVSWVSFEQDDLLLTGSSKSVEGWNLPKSNKPALRFSLSTGTSPQSAALFPKTPSPSPETPSTPEQILVRTSDDMVLFDVVTKRPVAVTRLALAEPGEGGSRGRPRRGGLLSGSSWLGCPGARLQPGGRGALVCTEDELRLVSMPPSMPPPKNWRDGAVSGDDVVWGGAAHLTPVNTRRFPSYGLVQWAEVRADWLGAADDKGFWFADLGKEGELGQGRWRSWGSEPVAQIDWAPGSGRVAALDLSGGLQLGDMNRALVRREPLAREIDFWRGGASMSMSADGQWVAVGSEQEIGIWETKSAKPTWFAPLKPSASDGSAKVAVAAVSVITDKARAPLAAVGDSLGGVHVFRSMGKASEELARGEDPVPPKPLHSKSVSRLEWGDASHLASGAADGTVVFWDIQERPSNKLTGLAMAGKHDGKITALQRGADHLISADENGGVRVWDTKTGARVCGLAAHDHAVVRLDVANLPDSPAASTRTLVASSLDTGDGAVLWEVASCTVIHRFEGVLSAGFANDQIVTVSAGGVEFWTLEALRNRSSDTALPTGAWQWAGFAGDRLVAGDEKGGVFTWIAQEKAAPVARAHGPLARNISLSTRGGSRLVALTKEGGWLSWSGASGEPTTGALALPHTTASDAVTEVLDATLSPDGAQLAVVVGRRSRDGGDESVPLERRLAIFEGDGLERKGEPVLLQTGTGCSSAGRAGQQSATDVIPVKEGFRVLAVEASGCVQIWKESGKLVRENTTALESPAVVAVLAPDESHMVIAHESAALSFWDLKDKDKVKIDPIGWEPDRHRGRVTSIALHPGGRFAATSGDDGQAWLWDVERGKSLGRLGNHPGEIRWALWTPTGSRVLTGGADAWLRAWDTRTTTADIDDLETALRAWMPQ